MRRPFPDFRALGVYERFEDIATGFHMHTLIGGCKLNLVPATYKNETEGDFLYTDIGNQIFNCTNWNNGLNTVVCIDPRSHQLQVVNYMSKYMNKESPAPYGCKRYLHTNNLESATQYLYYMSEEDIHAMILDLGLQRKPDKKAEKKQKDDIQKQIEADKKKADILQWASSMGIDMRTVIEPEVKSQPPKERVGRAVEYWIK